MQFLSRLMRGGLLFSPLMFVLAVPAMAGTRAPVWIVSESSSGLVIQWEAARLEPVQVFIATSAGTRTYPLHRLTGTMIIPSPSPPYRIGYRIQSNDDVVLKELGQLPPVRSRRGELSGNQPPGARVAIEIQFNTGVQKVWLVAPSPAEHLKAALAHATRRVELFIKVDPSGKVTGISSPYYSDPIDRELVGAASEVAMKRWRFPRQRAATYRDARLQFSFSRSGTRISSFTI